MTPPTPPTRKEDLIEDHFGTPVADPYRWLEQIDAPEVGQWVAAQAAVTREYLDALPLRAAFAGRLQRLSAFARSGVPVSRGPSWFRTTNDGEQQQDVLRVGDDPLGPGRVLLDPNPLTPGSTTALGSWSPSESGRLLAYHWMEAGSDWQTWRVRDVATGADLPDVVSWAKFTGAAWLPDDTGFFYGGFVPPPPGSEFTATNLGHRILLHTIGDPADRVVLETPDRLELTFDPSVTPDGRFLVVHANQGTDHRTLVWVRDLAGEPELRPLIAEADASWHIIGSAGDTLIAVTDLDASAGRLVALDPVSGAVTELIAARPDILEDARLGGDGIVVHWLRDARSVLTYHDLDGVQRDEIALPGSGSVLDLSARPGRESAFVQHTSFVDPPSVLAIDLPTRAVRPGLVPATDLADDIVTDQHWIVSADGTRLPVFVVHRAGVTPGTGPNPALLYGYGGFRIPVTPQFNLLRAAFVDAGGVLAVPSLRGGGEYGAAWHDAGRLRAKQNVFDDAIAAAEFLVSAGWTDPAHLAATGGSNGGLLAGALLTQRPDLFAAVVPEVGVLDMLRFMHFTIGWAWTSDYGDPSADAEDFAAAYAYSPLHRLTDGVAYPPTLILTSDHDDRVMPAHSFKFAARLQATGAPLALLRVEIASGHGAGRARAATVAERADVLAFLAAHTGLRPPA